MKPVFVQTCCITKNKKKKKQIHVTLEKDMHLYIATFLKNISPHAALSFPSNGDIFLLASCPEYEDVYTQLCHFKTKPRRLRLFMFVMATIILAYHPQQVKKG